ATMIDTLSVGPSLVAARRLSLQEQATPLQKGLMAPQPSSLRTSFRALSITRTEIKESGIYTGRRQVFVEWGNEILAYLRLNYLTSAFTGTRPASKAPLVERQVQAWLGGLTHFFLGSSAGLTYVTPQGPVPLSCTITSSWLQAKWFVFGCLIIM